MAWKFGFDGAGIARRLRRLLDQRDEPRAEPGEQSGILHWRGCDHDVTVSNLSASGAMLVCAESPPVGEDVTLRLLDRGPVAGQVRWVREGRVGISFLGSRP